MTLPDRPARPARTKPVPTADAGVDPIDYRPAQPDPTPEPTTIPTTPDEGKGDPTPAVQQPALTPDVAEQLGPRATVQSGISWSPETEAIVRAAKARTGKTRRALVEEAIARVWAD